MVAIRTVGLIRIQYQFWPIFLIFFITVVSKIYLKSRYYPNDISQPVPQTGFIFLWLYWPTIWLCILHLMLVHNRADGLCTVYSTYMLFSQYWSQSILKVEILVNSYLSYWYDSTLVMFTWEYHIQYEPCNNMYNFFFLFWLLVLCELIIWYNLHFDKPLKLLVVLVYN